MNPLDLPGPSFLAFYALATAGAAALALLLRHALSGPGGPPTPMAYELHPIDVAWLKGGPKLAALAALASLTQQRVIAVDPDSRTLKVVAPLPARAHPLERAAVDQLATSGDAPAAIMAVESTPLPSLPRLERLGLTPEQRRERRLRLAAASPLVGVLIVGFAKLAVGVSRDRPVGLLLFALVLVGMLTVFIGRLRILRTRRGSTLLAELASANKGLKASALSTDTSEATGSDVAMAIALFGPAMLGAYWLGDLQQALVPPSGSSGDSGSSCGSSSSCGGGCGGGGCGGCS